MPLNKINISRNAVNENMQLTLEEINQRIDHEHDILDEIWRTDDGSSYELYFEKCRPHWEERDALRAAMIMKLDKENARTYPLDEHEKQDLIPIKEFEAACKSHAIVSSDGFGYYATKEVKYLDFDADPDAFEIGVVRPDFDYIIWYNK